MIKKYSSLLTLALVAIFHMAAPTLLIAQTPGNGATQNSFVQALQKVRDEMKAAGVADPGKDPDVLNTLGYRAMYEDNDPQKALTYFRWNLVLFPKYASQLQDSLAEGCLQAGDIERAVEHYTKADTLDPQNPHAASIIATLKADPGSLRALQQKARQAYREELAKQPPPSSK